jgi:hypothetical protein
LVLSPTIDGWGGRGLVQVGEQINITRDGNVMKRPRSVTFIGVLLLVQGLVLSIAPGVLIGFIMTDYMDMLPANEPVNLSVVLQESTLSFFSSFVVGIFALVSSIGLLRMRYWGWLMAMIVQGVAMTIKLIEYWRGPSDYVQMFVSVIIVFYLNQRHIRYFFDMTRNPANLQREPDEKSRQIVDVEAEQAVTRESAPEVAQPK